MRRRILWLLSALILALAVLGTGCPKKSTLREPPEGGEQDPTQEPGPRPPR
ncbi:MAG: hypothetical protein GYA21_11575 [Myxococcales bacterium]|nr:hypothetical protein [Myxococcales bacterium]